MDTKNLTKLVAFGKEARHERLFETPRLWSELVCLDKNQETKPMAAPSSDVLFTIVAGRVVIYIDRKFKRFRQWGAVVAPAGSEVVLKNAGEEPAVVLVVAAPPPVD